MVEDTFDEERYNRAVEWFRRNAAGYWTRENGQLCVSFHTPGFWERFVGWLNGEHWQAYGKRADIHSEER